MLERPPEVVIPHIWSGVVEYGPRKWPSISAALETHLKMLTNANAPVASMKDSGVLSGRGGGESSLSQQSGLKFRGQMRSKVNGWPRRKRRSESVLP